MRSGSRATPTATLLAKSKKTRQTLDKITDLTHAQALERVAEDVGYSSWYELLHACDSANYPHRGKDICPSTLSSHPTSTGRSCTLRMTSRTPLAGLKRIATTESCDANSHTVGFFDPTRCRRSAASQDSGALLAHRGASQTADSSPRCSVLQFEILRHSAIPSHCRRAIAGPPYREATSRSAAWPIAWPGFFFWLSRLECVSGGRVGSCHFGVKADFVVGEEDVKPSEALASNRAAIRHVVESHRARNARVFGSVLRGQDTDSSDLDILIDPTPETTLFDISAIRVELRKLLGVPVDVLTPNGLPDKFRATVLAEASPV